MTNTQHTARPWAYDEDDARIYYADGHVEPTIAYIERENTSPERARADGYLLAAAPQLLEACKTLAEDCRMALSGEWDKSDDGFQASLELLESVIRDATGGATSPQLTKTITVKVEGGLVQDVGGVPRGYELRVEDYDGDDTSHPAWDADKECFVTIYDGGARG
jgi:hypothetical protein